LDVLSTFHWKNGVPPSKHLLTGQIFEVITTMTARRAGIDLAKRRAQDQAFQMTIRTDLKVRDLVRTVADFLIENGMRGNIRLDAEPDEPIEFERVCEVCEIDAVSVTRSAVAEALEWTHTSEEGLDKRPTQRVVFYPPSLCHLAAVLESGEPSLDAENGHDRAYEKILNVCAKFVSPPLFYRSDQLDSLTPETAAKVSG
jgi:hypothetical protein